MYNVLDYYLNAQFLPCKHASANMQFYRAELKKITTASQTISVSYIFRFQNEHKKQHWQWVFLRFLWWIYIKFGRLVVNVLGKSELVYQGDLWSQSFCRGKRDRCKNCKNCLYKPYFFVCLNLVSCLRQCAVKILQDITNEKSIKSHIKQ